MKLADGSMWTIEAGDKRASFIVSCFTEAMQLQPVHEPACQLLVLGDSHRIIEPVFGADLFDWVALPPKNNASVIYILEPVEDDKAFVVQLIRLSLVICLHAQTRGGLLLHGALAERRGDGVILTGPGNIGKTTASQRLTPPWRSLCDDLTLVVRDAHGTYWAHPWPTWSRFLSGGPGGTWDVQHAVPLKGIFFLTQAQEDRINPMGVGQAVCMLVESAEHIWGRIPRNEVGVDKIRALRLQRFDNICTLAQAVPCYLLHLSLTGKFWQKIEKVLAFEDKR